MRLDPWLGVFATHAVEEYSQHICCPLRKVYGVFRECWTRVRQVSQTIQRRCSPTVPSMRWSHGQKSMVVSQVSVKLIISRPTSVARRRFQWGSINQTERRHPSRILSRIKANHTLIFADDELLMHRLPRQNDGHASRRRQPSQSSSTVLLISEKFSSTLLPWMLNHRACREGPCHCQQSQFQTPALSVLLPHLNFEALVSLAHLVRHLEIETAFFTSLSHHPSQERSEHMIQKSIPGAVLQTS